jgi:hypothetical protein
VRIPANADSDSDRLFGVVKKMREFVEGSAALIEIELDYSSSPRVPTNYEGVSGGALWELHIELDGERVVRIRKKLKGVAFRQSEDRSLIFCNGTPSIESLTDIAKTFPDA